MRIAHTFQRGFRRKFLKAFVRIYPKLSAIFEFWTLMLQLGYLVHKLNVHSPWLYMADVILRVATADEFSYKNDKIINSHYSSNFASKLSTVWSRFFGWLCRMLGMALLYVQFLDWWQNNERERKVSLTLPIPKPPHNIVISERAILQSKPYTCPICKEKRRNDTVLAVSGYVFCYSCIFQYLKRRKCCPVTKIPATTEHLVRLFVPPPAASCQLTKNPVV